MFHVTSLYIHPFFILILVLICTAGRRYCETLFHPVLKFNVSLILEFLLFVVSVHSVCSTVVTHTSSVQPNFTFLSWSTKTQFHCKEKKCTLKHIIHVDSFTSATVRFFVIFCLATRSPLLPSGRFVPRAASSKITFSYG